MNPNFTITTDSRRNTKSGDTALVRVKFKGECIAVFAEEDRKAGDPRSLRELALEYLSIYGYMAEHRRQWNNKNHINWTDDLFVDWKE